MTARLPEPAAVMTSHVVSSMSAGLIIGMNVIQVAAMMSRMNCHLAHLAQMNIAWMHGRIGDPVMSGLAARVDEIYHLADRSPGFVWRLPSSGITPETLEPFESVFPGFQRDKLFYNMSVWETVEALRSYTFASAHAELLNERYQWIDKIAGASTVLWWIGSGARPTIAESVDRWRHLQAHGPTPHAFTLRRSFDPA